MIYHNPLKIIPTIALVLGIISYTIATVPLAFAFELSTPNKNLQVQWWKWILGIPEEDSPVLDETGEDCEVDQKGPVWYLAGFAGSSEEGGGGSAVRDCTIPEGKDILIPVFNTVCAEQTDAGLIKQALGLEDDDEILPSQLKEGLIRCTDLILSFVTTLQFSIDGEAVEDFDNFRVVSPQFQIVYPEGNVFNQSPTDVKQKAVAQGYWILVEDLEPGEHTIEVVSVLTFDNTNFETSVTYDLTVEPKQASSLSDSGSSPILGKMMGKSEQGQLPEDEESVSVLDKLLSATEQ